MVHLAATPYPWPYDGDLRPANTALIVIDMQTDFCGVGGYVDKMGYDLSLTRAPIEPIRAVLAAMRAKGFTVRTPVLLLSGGIDPATPPRHAARVAQALGVKARHVVVPNAGHGLLGSGCVPDLLYRFIDAADDAQALTLDTACITTIPRPGAFVPPAPESAR